MSVIARRRLSLRDEQAAHVPQRGLALPVFARWPRA